MPLQLGQAADDPHDLVFRINQFKKINNLFFFLHVTLLKLTEYLHVYFKKTNLSFPIQSVSQNIFVEMSR